VNQRPHIRYQPHLGSSNLTLASVECPRCGETGNFTLIHMFGEPVCELVGAACDTVRKHLATHTETR
jgi:hypothetical protein